MLYDQIDQAIEAHRDEALQLLQELVRIPSLEGAEKPCMDVLERQLRAMSLDVDRWIPDDEELAAHPAYVPTGWSYAERPNVVGIYRGAGGGKSLKLNGHVDVVPIGPPELWEHGTLERRFRRWQGLRPRQRRYERRRRQQCLDRACAADGGHPTGGRPDRRLRRRRRSGRQWHLGDRPARAQRRCLHLHRANGHGSISPSPTAARNSSASPCPAKKAASNTSIS